MDRSQEARGPGGGIRRLESRGPGDVRGQADKIRDQLAWGRGQEASIRGKETIV